LLTVLKDRPLDRIFIFNKCNLRKIKGKKSHLNRCTMKEWVEGVTFEKLVDITILHEPVRFYLNPKDTHQNKYIENHKDPIPPSKLI
jgi:hypothetical protein